MNLSKPVGESDASAEGPASGETVHPSSPASAPAASEADVGSALRQAFRATVEEEVPDAMLDLLRRLN